MWGCEEVWESVWGECGRPVARNFFQGGPVGAHIFITYVTSNTNLANGFFDAPFQT